MNRKKAYLQKNRCYFSNIMRKKVCIIMLKNKKKNHQVVNQPLIPHVFLIGDKAKEDSKN
jgi:hypothetical protein